MKWDFLRQMFLKIYVTALPISIIYQIHELIKFQPGKIENNKTWRSTEVLQESVELVWAGYMGLSGYIDGYMGHICGCVGVILLYGACKGWQLYIRGIYNYGVNRLLSKSTFKKHIQLPDGIASAFFVEWMATRMRPSQKRSADFHMTCCFLILNEASL